MKIGELKEGTLVYNEFSDRLMIVIAHNELSCSTSAIEFVPGYGQLIRYNWSNLPIHKAGWKIVR